MATLTVLLGDVCLQCLDDVVGAGALGRFGEPVKAVEQIAGDVDAGRARVGRHAYGSTWRHTRSQFSPSRPLISPSEAPRASNPAVMAGAADASARPGRRLSS